ncbi:3-hydroxyacyl-CoA dehydrogenase [Chryseobacterium sp. W4I1]|nr:3-hydroxyacyl-CoA dehydrogenase [Chryseobacterium sp. W4I1]
MIKNIVVIGAGTMGNGIAHTFAQSGFKVNLVDVSQDALDRGLKTITTNLDRIIAKGNLTEEQKAETLGNITTFTELKEAAGNADLIVEAATENLDLKLKIFGQMDDSAPEHCILATNTSSISITKIAAATKKS